MAESVRRMVCDTHVFLRANIDAPSAEREAYGRLIRICFRMVVNRRILEEYRAIASRHGLSGLDIDEELGRLRSLGKLEQAGNPRSRVQTGPAQDRPFLDCCLSSSAQYLVTNDDKLRDASDRLNQRSRSYRTRALSPEEVLLREEG